MKGVVIIFLLLSKFGHAQNYSDTVKALVSRYHLKPISELDTTSPIIPKNFVTASGWHVDFYGEYEHGYLNSDGQQAFREIKLEAFIYKENYMFSYYDWLAFNIDEIIYDSVYYFEETPSLLCFKSKSRVDETEDLIVFPKQVDTVGYSAFSELVNADYDNGIFIELDYSCVAPEALALKVTNVYSWQSTMVVFSKKGDCNQKDKTQWLKKVSYLNGILTIEVVLKNRRTKKEFVETKKIKI